VALYLLVGLWSRLRFLGAFASPVLFAIGVFALMPNLDANHGSRPELPTTWTSVHAALMSLSYGAFGLSAVAALMYLTQERNLKFHKLQAVFSLMPPIQRLEATAGRLLAAGFILLTLGLLSGIVDMTHLNNPQLYRGDPKIVWSICVWFLYLALIIMRWRFAQGGRRFALSAIGSFVFISLTFWGTNILSPLHNP
jgi:HemX protein